MTGSIAKCFWSVCSRRWAQSPKNRNTHEWLNAVVESSADGIIAIDERGIITLYNPAAESMFGWQPREIIGQPVEVLMSEEFREQHHQHLRGYFTTGMPRAAIGQTIELTGRRRNGTRFPLELSLSAGNPSGQRFALAMIRDITERKQREADLCRAKELAEKTASHLRRLSRAVKHNPASIVITDLHGSIEYVNPGFVQNTGYTLEEVFGKNPRILKSAKHTAEFYEKMWQTLNQGEVWRDAICNRKKNGGLFWEDATIAPVFDEHEKVTHYVAVKMDISARRHAENELKEALEELHRTTALQQAILNGTEYAIIATRIDGIINVFNSGAERMLGYRADEVVGKVTPAIFHDQKEVLARSQELTTELGTSIPPGFETFVAKSQLGFSDERP
jgi:PAS domain S-box-containing protein